MALKVKSEKLDTNGKALVFFLFFFILLISFAIVLAISLFVVGKLNTINYIYFYKIFSPGTVVLPLIIALTTVLAFKRSIMTITPASSFNVDKLQEFFFKNGYEIVEEKSNYFRFQRKSFMSRLLWFNLDQPIIQVTENEVKVTLKKLTEISLTPHIIYGKNFDLSTEK